VAGTRLGIVRIDVFDPHGDAAGCEAAVASLELPIDRPCDEACDNQLVTAAYRRFGAQLEARLRALKAAGAEALIVDIGSNEGGSEWAEAAARMLTATPLQAARLAYVRGPHWAKIWGDLAERLRDFAKAAEGKDRAALLGWAARADAARAEAGRRCNGSTCPRLAQAGYATGLIGAAPEGALSDKPWGVWLFNPAQHLYHEGVWNGPLMLLTDNETWSAAEEVAAMLQDNRAAVLIGGRTGGAGCGHTWGGTPTTLANSRAVLQLPDCVRLRADGSNEVRGVLPDVPVAIRANDGAALKARLIAERLPEAIARARALHDSASARK
jgi:C-terminal processing protease CtpA/Prc